MPTCRAPIVNKMSYRNSMRRGVSSVRQKNIDAQKAVPAKTKKMHRAVEPIASASFPLLMEDRVTPSAEGGSKRNFKALLERRRLVAISTTPSARISVPCSPDLSLSLRAVPSSLRCHPWVRAGCMK